MVSTRYIVLFYVCQILVYVAGKPRRDFSSCVSCDGSTICVPNNTASCPNVKSCSSTYSNVCKSLLNKKEFEMKSLINVSSTLKNECLLNLGHLIMDETKKKCPLHQKFSDETQRCMNAEEFQILNDYQKFKDFKNFCWKNGISPDPKNCKKYFVCYPGQLYGKEYTCPKGMFFNRTAGYCTQNLTKQCSQQLLERFSKRLSSAENLYQIIRQKFIKKNQFRHPSTNFRNTLITEIQNPLTTVKIQAKYATQKPEFVIQKFSFHNKKRSYGTTLSINPINEPLENSEKLDENSFLCFSVVKLIENLFSW